MGKLLSIIVPAYNMEKFLPKCLGSLVVDDAALLERMDVIVVNDGSKDRTSEIAHELEAKHPGVVRVIDKPNGHYGSCVNAALKVAVGKYVHMLDADDYVITSRFAKYLDWLGTVDVDVAVNDWEYVDEEDRPFDHSGYAFFPVDEAFTPREIPDAGCLLGVHALAYRTEILRKMDYRQTGGVAYSDQEWFTIPMTQVSSVCYFPHKVFRYLYGRADQSVNKEVARRSQWMNGVVLTRLIEDYPHYTSVGTPEGRDYYRRKVSYVCKAFCSDAIYTDFSKDDRFDLVAFDELLRVNAPDIYASLDEIRPSRWLPIRPVHEWRRHGHRTVGWGFFMLQLYSALVRFVR